MDSDHTAGNVQTTHPMILQPHHTNDLLYRSQQQMREQQRQVLQEAHSDTCNTRAKAVLNIITYGFILRNELINDNMSEALELLKKEPALYKQEIKKQAKFCEQGRRAYEGGGGILSTIGVRDSLLDTLDDIYDRYKDTLNNSMTQLYYALKQELDNQKVPRSAMLAQIELTRILIDCSCKRGETDKTYDAILTPVLENLSYLLPTEIQKRWDKLCNLVYNRASAVKVNLNTKRAEQCFKAFAKEISNYNLIGNLLAK